MNLIEEVRLRDQAELQERLQQFDTTILIMSHAGDVAPSGGFEVVRARTLKEFVNAEVKRIYAFDQDDLPLCKAIVASQEVLGFNVRVVESFPDQHSVPEVNAILAPIPRIDFLRLLGDIADQRLIESNMTETELLASKAKLQHSQRVDKHGDIKPLIDFDRSFQDEQEPPPPEE